MTREDLLGPDAPGATVYPRYADRLEGGRMCDVDGNPHLDSCRVAARWYSITLMRGLDDTRISSTFCAGPAEMVAATTTIGVLRTIDVLERICVLGQRPLDGLVAHRRRHRRGGRGRGLPGQARSGRSSASPTRSGPKGCHQ